MYTVKCRGQKPRRLESFVTIRSSDKLTKNNFSKKKLAYHTQQKDLSTNMSSSSKIVILTGASSGMGRATAIYLAQKGHVQAMTLFARRKEPLEELAAELQKDFPTVKTLVVTGDAANAVDNKKAVEETVSTFGGLTGIFVNAGVFKGGAPIVDTTDEDVDAVIDV